LGLVLSSSHAAAASLVQRKSVPSTQMRCRITANRRASATMALLMPRSHRLPPAMAERNAEVPQDRRIEFRVGIHQGDVIIEEGDVFGDGVNVAARLEGIAEPGGICVSGRVQEDAEGKLELAFEDAGEQQLKNIARPVRVYRVRLSGAASSSRP